MRSEENKSESDLGKKNKTGYKIHKILDPFLANEQVNGYFFSEAPSQSSMPISFISEMHFMSSAALCLLLHTTIPGWTTPP